MQNPYVHRGMISDPEAFFGRQKELARLYALLAEMQSVSVVGERRIGKSSLLYCAHFSQIQARVPVYDFTSHVFAYLDLTKLVKPTPTAFLRYLLEGLRHADERLSRLQLKQKVGPEEFEDFIDKVNGKGLRPVFLLDEFDIVARVEEFDLTFFDFLRSLANGRDLAFVTASTRRLMELCHASVMSSPFFNIFAAIPLGVLERDEALKLIKEPSNRASCSLAEEVDFLLELAGRHPFFLQIACFYLFEAKVRGEGVDHDHVTKLFKEEADNHFSYLWEHLEDKEKHGIRAELKAENEKHEYELLESSTFRQFIEEQDNVVANTSVTMAEDQSDTENWSRHLVRQKSFYVGVIVIVASLAVAIFLDASEALLLVIGTLVALIIDEFRKMI